LQIQGLDRGKHRFFGLACNQGGKVMKDIGDYMSSPVLSVDSEVTVQEAAHYMHAHKIGAVFVKNGGEFVGIVTDRDLTRKVVGKGLNAESTIITSIMTSPIISFDRYLPVEEANIFMHKNKIRHLAITEEEKIVGVLSVKDLISYFTKDFRMEE
jgi:signal-transduction protein with cAMP-binding, CBS, and nucleotidyltransferase domain